MNVVTKARLTAFSAQNPKAAGPLSAWYSLAKRANWSSPQDIKRDFGSADSLPGNRVVFNIGGNNYRLVVHVSYRFKQVLVKFIGTHAEYDKIDAVTI